MSTFLLVATVVILIGAIASNGFAYHGKPVSQYNRAQRFFMRVRRAMGG